MKDQSNNHEVIAVIAPDNPEVMNPKIVRALSTRYLNGPSSASKA
jgi:hypothetical protein